MTHSAIDPIAHITEPIVRFLDKVIPYDPSDSMKPAINIPKHYFSPPSNWGRVQPPSYSPNNPGGIGSSQISSSQHSYLGGSPQGLAGHPVESHRRPYGQPEAQYTHNFPKASHYQGLSQSSQTRGMHYEGLGARPSQTAGMGSQRSFGIHQIAEPQPSHYGWRTQQSVSQPPARR